ncbi:MAG TPA: family 20 glycosylhydrolase [Rhizomicrobium sp.]|nr:family 20 glycosylhydrolase [Rhizomicrobium sp.]
MKIHRGLGVIGIAAVTALPAACSREIPTPPPVEKPAAAQVSVPQPSIIPWPAHVAPAPGALALQDGAPILYDASDAETPRLAHYLADLVRRTQGPLLVPRAGDVTLPPAHAIVLRRLADRDETGAEGYKLDVTPDGMVIAAGQGAGLFYGAVTAWQLLTQTPSHGVAIPAMRIDDVPRFRWRGLLLDSARHYQSPEFIEAFIDAMALHKLNVLQWHLTDDQAWRLEIRRYPRLTKIGAWRVPEGAAAAHDIDPRTHKPRLYGGYYSQAQVRAIVRYAAARHVSIVPEIEMPGHATAAIVAYPKLGSTSHPPKAVPSAWGVFDNLYNVDDSTFRFLDNVLTEVMALFPGEYIHVGGDEAVKDQWKASPKIQAQMKKLGIANEDALQSYFIARIGKFLSAHGRKLIGWDEILEGGVAPNATITSWRGVDGAVTAAKSGHDAVLSPAPDLYFDNRQGTGPDQPPGREYLLTLERVYGFDAMPDHLSEAERTHIIGVQANIWTEHIRTDERVDLMAFPRAAALAEVGWSAKPDWKNFLARLAPQMARYKALGIVASPTAFKVEAETAENPVGATVRLGDQSGFGDVHYTLDGSAPSAASPLYSAPLFLPLPQHLRAAAFDGAREIVDPTDVTVDAMSLRHRFSQELELCSKDIALNLEDDAPLRGPRAIFLADIMNPCWIWRGADLNGISGIAAGVGQVPFNFEIGDDRAKIVLRPPATPAGELEVHRDSCDGPKIAVLPLAPALSNNAVTRLTAPLSGQDGAHDLCFAFTQKKLDPLWLLDWVQLVPNAH